MKKIRLTTFVLGILTMAGCTQYQEEMELPEEGGTTLEVSVEGEPITRVGFDSQGTFYWSNNDVLGVTTTQSKQLLSELNLVSGGGTSKAIFSGKTLGAIEGYAIYPYSDFHEFSGSTLSFYLPASYTYDKIDSDFFSAKQGEGVSFNASMWGGIQGGKISMRHLGGIMCVKVNELPIGDNLKLEISSMQKMNGFFTCSLTDNEPKLTTEKMTQQDENKITFLFKNQESKRSGVFYAPVPVGTFDKTRIKLFNGDIQVANIGVGSITVSRTKLKVLNIQDSTIEGGNGGGDSTAKEASASLLFGSQNDEQNLNLNMKSNWHVEVEGEPVTRAATTGNDWITISPMSGQAGNVTISTKTNANTTKQNRKGRIRIVSDDDDDIDLDVLQVSDEAMVVAKPKYTYGPTGGSLELDVDDLEDNFTIETTVGWIKNNSLPDDDDRRLFEITENTSASPRYGKVIFTSGKGKAIQVIEFEQLGNDGQVNPGTNPGGGILIISSQNQTFDCNPHEFDIEVLSNTEFQVETPSLPWMHHVETIGQRIHFSVDANATYEGRNALIRIYNTKNNQMTMLSVNQMQKDAIILANPMYQYTQFGGTLKFEVGHNVEYDMAIDVDWIKQAPQTKAFTHDALEFIIAENKTNDNREGHITFTSKDKAITQTVLVKQAQVDAMIIKQTEFRLDDKEQTITVDVESNVPFEIVNHTPWIHQQTAPATKGMTPSALTFLVDQNGGYSERTGELIIRSTDMKQKATITVTQSQHNAIVLPRAIYTVDFNGGPLTAEVEANVEYTVTTDADWIHYTPAPATRALVKSGVTVNIDKNPIQDQSREGHIILTTADGVKAEITVRQLPESMQHEINVRRRLTDFYKAVDGDGWWQNTNWCTDAPLNTWHGVTFENDLLTLNLSENSVRGDVDLSNFDELASLTLNDDYLTSLNVSGCKMLKTLICDRSLIETINPTNCPLLETLSCRENKFETIPLTGLGELKSLNLSYCPITSLDLLPVTKLQTLTLEECTSLYELDVNHLKELREISGSSSSIKELDCSNMPKLESLTFDWGSLRRLKLSGCTDLLSLDLYYNKGSIRSLNISDCKKLNYLNTVKNNILKYIVVWDGFIEEEHTSFKKDTGDEYIKYGLTAGEPLNINASFKKSLIYECDYNVDDEISVREAAMVKALEVNNRGIKGEIDLSPFYQLESLNINYNAITGINLKECRRLTSLSCSNNQLTTLDLSNCTNLTSLYSSSNQLTTLNLFNCTSLTTLYCYSNQLTTIDLSNCTSLTTLYCYCNQLTTLDISNNKMLKDVSVSEYRDTLDELYVWKGFDSSLLKIFNNQTAKIIEK